MNVNNSINNYYFHCHCDSCWMLTEESAISSLKWSVLQKICIPVFLVAPCMSYMSYTYFRRLSMSLGSGWGGQKFSVSRELSLSWYIIAHVPRKTASV